MSRRQFRPFLVAAVVLLASAGVLLARTTVWRGPQGTPTLTAAPNPVPAGAGPGSTTITWSTGSGSVGQVYVSEDGGPETLLTQGQAGSQAAPWIVTGRSYEFRLYAARDRSTPLATVTVTRQ